MEEKTERKNREILEHSQNDSEVTGNLRRLSEESWEEICEYRRLLDELSYQKCLLELEKIKNEQLR